MPEAQTPRVEHRPRNSFLASSVFHIARNRITECGEVHTNLVSPPGVKFTAHESMPGSSIGHLVSRSREPAAADDGHSLPIFRVTSDGSFELTGVVLDQSPDDGHIRPAERTVLQLRGECSVAQVVAGDDDEARCAFVEPVNNARTSGTSDGRPVSAPTEKRVYQRAGVVAGRRVNDHPGGLVDDRKVFVFIDHLKRYLLGSSVGDVRLGDLELNHVPGCDTIRGIRGPAVDANEMALDEARGSRAAEVVSVLGEKAVQPKGRGRRDQAVGLGRIKYPATSATTPTLIAESATLKTGQKWTLIKSVTVPNVIRS